MRRRWLILLVTTTLVACASDPGSSNPASSPSSASTAPSATDLPSSSTDSIASSSTSTTVLMDSTPRYTADALSAAGTCSLDPPTTDGQITFIVGNRLYGSGADGALKCLADLNSRAPTWLSWSPDADELLAGPDVLLRANGTTSTTGYFADNNNVRWSAPTGKALIAPKASTGELIWRNAHNSAERINVSFADEITSASYHPAGKHIAATGIGRDGQGPGVFVASNRGANSQRIGQLEPGTIATDVAFDMAGTSLVFVHGHPDGSAHVHRYHFDSNQLDMLADVRNVTPTDLTVSRVDNGDVAWAQTASRQDSSVRVLLDGSTESIVVRAPDKDRATAPIGWLPGHRLLISSKSFSEASTSPFDIWEWSPSGMRLLVQGATAAAARTLNGPYSELTIIQGSGFG